uniref:Zinc finger, CCHC-type n=1 Tax=Tanacetum cinerariifolium TaxID=118510 RepID=A0A6L2NYX5_TANCI|nr:zinc finger, CCHC-type [Tanacetum cinerariifolium]
MHNNIMATGSRDRPPMLAMGIYAQWQSRFLRYIDIRPNGDALRKCILEVETILITSPEIKAHYQSKKKAIHLLLTGIGDEFYLTVDACKTAPKMWIATERLQQGESLNIQDLRILALHLVFSFPSKFWSSSGVPTSFYNRDPTSFELLDLTVHNFNSIEEDPGTYNEAMQSRDVAFWKEAIDDEIGFIMKNNTWVLSDLPPGCKPLDKREGIDYFDTYAPLALITTIRLLLALAAIHNLVIHQMDEKTTYLNADLEEEMYMKQLEGFVMPGNEHTVCKPVKSLYGLKQAPKQWHQKFNEVVLSSGFHLNQSDKCVYSKIDDSGKGVIICLYVDDMLIFGIDQNQVDKTKKFLSSSFLMKDMGEADVIFGIKIKRENKGIVITVTQSHYIEKILKKFNREDCYPVSTTIDLIEKLKPNTCKHVDQLEYSRAIGCLMYVMTSTRPDIAFVVGRLSKFTSYSDASWISHVEDSSSTSGWVFLLGGGAISWASKNQTCITGSIIESEFVALVVAGKEAE